MSLFHAKIEGVPQFVSYFAPVHRAMQHLSGQATPKQVYAYLAEHEGLTAEDIGHVNQNGKPTFENRAAWARFYMTKAGWMYAPKHGIWALTEKGKQSTELTQEQAVALFKSAQTQFKGHEEEVEAPQDHVQPEGTHTGLQAPCGMKVTRFSAFCKKVSGKTATRTSSPLKYKL